MFLIDIDLYSGGPWRMPPQRPKCLRPMLDKEEYRIFAEEINRIVAWDVFSAETMWYYVFCLLVPPLSAMAMVSVTVCE